MDGKEFEYDECIHFSVFPKANKSWRRIIHTTRRRPPQFENWGDISQSSKNMLERVRVQACVSAYSLLVLLRQYVNEALLTKILPANDIMSKCHY